MANKSKYADLGQEALVEAIKARRTAGRTVKVDLRAKEDVLRAALDNDDMENGEFTPDAPTGDGKPPEGAKTPATEPDPKAGAKPPEAAKKPAVPSVSAKVAALPDKLRNQVAIQPEAPTKPTQPTDDEFAAGTLARSKTDGLLYQVVRVTGDEFNKPVKARVPAQASGHPGFYWEGSEEEFSAHFEKE